MEPKKSGSKRKAPAKKATARRRPTPRQETDGLRGFPLYTGLTPNQVVAFNLARAREWRGWTQGQAAAALEPYLGVLWSKASVSQAERSVAGKVVRNFSADEIVAFSRAFGVPVAWFFMPPTPWAAQGMPVKLSVPDADDFGASLAELLDLVFGDFEGAALLGMRLQVFVQEVGVSYPLTEAQERIASLVRTKVATVARKSLADIRLWQATLEHIAGDLGALEVQARYAVSDELDVPMSELGGDPLAGAEREGND